MASVRVHRVCLLVLAAVMLVSACGGARTRYTAHLERGKQYQAAGNLDKASVEYRNALQIQPRDPDALYLNGRLAEQRGNAREAVGFYQAALESRPDFEQARASLGKLFVFGAAYQRALDIIAPGIISRPDSADLLAVRAAARHQLKDDSNARLDAERAVKLAPANENAISVLASLYQQAGDYPRAVALVGDAVRRVPASVDLRSVLANLYLGVGQLEQAEEQMRQVIALEPLVLAPRAQLAMHFARVGKLDAAQSILEDTVVSFSKGSDPSKTDEAKLLLVEFIASQRSREQGERTLRRFIAQAPDNLDLRLGLGALLQRTGALPEAVAVYREVIDRNGTGPKGLLARDRMAAIELLRGQPGAARKLVADVLARNPRDDDALVLRANLELESDDPAGAVGDLRAVLRDQPGSVSLQRTLARAYMQKGESELAEATLRSAVDAAPEDSALRIDLAQYLAGAGRLEQAGSMLEEAVRRMPQNPELRVALIRNYLAKRDFGTARTAADDLKILRPKDAAGFYYSGLIAFEQKRLPDSEKEFERSLELQPAGFETLAALARLEVSRGRAELAIARVRRAVDTDPRDSRAVNLLGELYLQSTDTGPAAQAFTRATTLDAKWWVPLRNLALVKMTSNDAQGAIAAYSAALKAAPGEPGLVLEATAFFEKHRQIDAVIAGYESLYKVNHRARQVAANNLAMVLVTYRTDQASLDRARDLTSGFASSANGALLDTNGWVRFKRGEYRDALPVLERALERAPESKVIRYHLGMAQLRLGLKDQARGNLEAAVADSAQFSGSDEARSVLAGLTARAG